MFHNLYTFKNLWLCLGALLLVINILGLWTPLGSYGSLPPAHWDHFSSALESETRSVDDLYRAAAARAKSPLESLPPAQAMQALYDVTSERTTLGHVARYSFYRNWLIALGGLINPTISAIRDSDQLLLGGHAMYCSQGSYLLLTLARRAGIPARHVGLYGHVVMEAWYEGDWHLYDPIGESVPMSNGRVLSVEDLSRDAQLVRDAYKHFGDPGQVATYVDIYTSRENNTFVSYPLGSHFEWKAQVLSVIEKIAIPAAWMIPLALILLSSLGRRRRPAKQRSLEEEAQCVAF